MSNNPGVSPLSPYLQDVRYSDDPAFDDARNPDEKPQAGQDNADQSYEQTTARIKRESIDLG